MKTLKNTILKNYEFLLCVILLFGVLIVAINPQRYMTSTFKGFSIWATIVLPSLFVFFILTKLLMQNKYAQSFFAILNKPFAKLYNTPNYSGYIFSMSIISGYPTGAQLISEFYKNDNMTKEEAIRLLSFCSTSGPMFILGSLASGLLNGNLKIGLIIFFSHLLATLLNGLIYRNYGKHNLNQKIVPKISPKKIEKDTLNEIMYNTIISSLMVGGFIALSFTLLEVLNSANIFLPLIKLIELIFPNSTQITESVVKGIIELTNGCVSLSLIKSISPIILSTLLSSLISFGGLSIHLQTNVFLQKVNIPYKTFFLIKFTQTLFTIPISIILSLLIL